MTASLYDFHQTQPSPNEKLRSMLAMILKKRISPNKADGFMTTGTHADSDAEGDGVNTTTSPGATPLQN